MIDPVLALDRAPRWLRDAVLGVAQGRGPLGGLADRVRFRFGADEVPVPPPISPAPVRILIGPADEAEQGYQWARAIERSRPDATATAMIGLDPGVYRVKSDLEVPTAVYLRSGAWHDAFEDYLSAQTHVLWESGLPLLGRRYGGDVAREAAVLAGRGVRGGHLFHGTDIRSPGLHAAESEWSPFRRPGLPIRVIEEKAERNRRRALASGMPIHVSTPELLRHVPGSVWCPIVVDPGDWETARDAWPRTARPVVVHAPSNPLFKGTHEIEPLLRRLDAEGRIEYRRIQGVPYAQMPRFYAEADIVLDHFLIGNYSMVTIEGLAAGCLAIGHVDAPSREAVRELAGLDVPVVEATLATLEAVLLEVLADPARFESIRATGPTFVRSVHDGAFSALQLAPFLDGRGPA